MEPAKCASTSRWLLQLVMVSTFPPPQEELLQERTHAQLLIGERGARDAQLGGRLPLGELTQKTRFEHRRPLAGQHPLAKLLDEQLRVFALARRLARLAHLAGLARRVLVERHLAPVTTGEVDGL